MGGGVNRNSRRAIKRALVQAAIASGRRARARAPGRGGAGLGRARLIGAKSWTRFGHRHIPLAARDTRHLTCARLSQKRNANLSSKDSEISFPQTTYKK